MPANPMNQEKIYVPQSRSVVWGSVGLFIMGLSFMAFDIVKMSQQEFTRFDPMQVVWFLFCIYCCFVSLHAAPKQVSFLENGMVRLVFLLGNSITVNAEKFVLDGKVQPSGKWTGVLRVRGRIIYFTSETYPEFSRYLQKE